MDKEVKALAEKAKQMGYVVIKNDATEILLKFLEYEVPYRLAEFHQVKPTEELVHACIARLLEHNATSLFDYDAIDNAIAKAVASHLEKGE